MKRTEENIFKVIMIIASLAIFGMLLFILGTIVWKGLPALSWDMITKLPGGGFYLGKEGGVLNAIAGSFYIILGAVAMSTIISVPLVMYVNFYLPGKSSLAGIVRFSFDILLGIPSIVYGAFGFALMIFLGMRASLGGGIITVAMLITPIMMRSFDEVTRLLPRSHRASKLPLCPMRIMHWLGVLRTYQPGFNRRLEICRPILAGVLPIATTTILTGSFSLVELMRPIKMYGCWKTPADLRVPRHGYSFFPLAVRPQAECLGRPFMIHPVIA